MVTEASSEKSPSLIEMYYLKQSAFYTTLTSAYMGQENLTATTTQLVLSYLAISDEMILAEDQVYLYFGEAKALYNAVYYHDRVQAHPNREWAARQFTDAESRAIQAWRNCLRPKMEDREFYPLVKDQIGRAFALIPTIAEDPNRYFGLPRAPEAFYRCCDHALIGRRFPDQTTQTVAGNVSFSAIVMTRLSNHRVKVSIDWCGPTERAGEFALGGKEYRVDEEPSVTTRRFLYVGSAAEIQARLASETAGTVLNPDVAVAPMTPLSLPAEVPAAASAAGEEHSFSRELNMMRDTICWRDMVVEPPAGEPTLPLYTRINEGPSKYIEGWKSQMDTIARLPTPTNRDPAYRELIQSVITRAFRYIPAIGGKPIDYFALPYVAKMVDRRGTPGPMIGRHVSKANSETGDSCSISALVLRRFNNLFQTVVIYTYTDYFAGQQGFTPHVLNGTIFTVHPDSEAVSTHDIRVGASAEEVRKKFVDTVRDTMLDPAHGQPQPNANTIAAAAAAPNPMAAAAPKAKQ